MLTTIAVFSYSTAAVAFLLLSVLLLTSWRSRLHGMLLTIACILSTLWAAVIAYSLAFGYTLSLFADVLEILRSVGWIAFLMVLLGLFQQRGTYPASRFTSLPMMVAAFFVLLILATIYLHWAHLEPYGMTAFVTGIVARAVMALTGLILVEQFYRNTLGKERWSIKYICLGIGGIFTYDFYLYSDAMLFRQANSEIWAARGIINALIVPLIAVSAARNPKWSLDISVSRRILFHSATLFGAAIYLLAMAAAGYFLRFFGGSWGTVLQAVFLFGAVILLIVLLFSGTLRSRLKVFISKHFYSYHYDYREEWLRFTRNLSEGESELSERAIQAIAELVESPGGCLWITRESGYCEPAARWNMPLPGEGEPIDSVFCRFLENKQWVIDLQEYDLEPEKYGDLVLPEWLRNIPRAWLVVPLIYQHKLFGFVMLSHSRSKIKLNWEVNDLLEIAGNQAASYLAQQEAARALMVARQFESFNRMSTFVVHDLKNLVAQLSLLLSNVEKHKNNPEFQKDMIETLDFSVNKMKRMLEKLSNGVAEEKSIPLQIDKLLLQAVAAKSFAEPKPELNVLDNGLKVQANWSSLERVIGHLIQNAVEATPKDGKVQVSLTGEKGAAIIEIRDTGHGMSEDFIRERLFKPFESTKTAGMGIGVFESQEYVRELGGRLEVISNPSQGTTFRVILPLYNQVSAAGEAT